MRLLITIKSSFELCTAVLEKYIANAAGFVREDNTVDWLGYYHYYNERALIISAARKNNPVIVARFIGTAAEKIVRTKSGISTRIKDLWLKRLHEDSRASLSEGRFISLMASMPVPPTRPVLFSGIGWNTTNFNIIQRG